MWWGRLYRHTQGAAAGQTGQRIGTLDDGLAGVEVAATAYANGIFFAQIDLTKSTCSLVPAPFPFLRWYTQRGDGRRHRPHGSVLLPINGSNKI